MYEFDISLRAGIRHLGWDLRVQNSRLIGVTYYGLDLYKKRNLAKLLEKLCSVEGIEWIRLHYAFPQGFPMDALDVIAREPRICKYLDMPLQHIIDNMLKSMRRGTTKGEAAEPLMARARRILRVAGN